MARTSPKRTGSGKRVIGPKTRFAPDLLALEDRSVPAFIYVDPNFTASQTTAQPAQAFNPSGTGPLGTVPANQLTFVAAGKSAQVTGTGKFATADVTTAFNAARDNPGADTILLAPGTFDLNNAQGKSATLSGGFNDNTYFFNSDPLSILGSGKELSTIRPDTDTFDPTDPDTDSDPLLAVRQGATFVANDFTLDGSQAVIGVGIGVSGGTTATLARVAVTNFSVSGAGASSFGFGLATRANTGGFVSVSDSSFSGNARVGVIFDGSNGQVLGSTFTGRGTGDLVDFGVQAVGASNVYVSGSTFTNYRGKLLADGSTSAALSDAQSVVNGQLAPGAARLIVVGNSITGNAVGVSTGASGFSDASVALVNFNDLSNNTVALDGTSSVAGPGTRTGIDGGIDGRNNYFGASGPARTKITGSFGDETVNPNGTGSAANGNVQIALFRPVTVPTTTVANPTFVADPAGSSTAPATGLAPALLAARNAFLGGGVALKIYVDAAFAGSTSGSAPNVAFNAGGKGPLGAVPAQGLTFVPTGTPYGPNGVTVAGSYAVPDLTTAFGLARDNPGADVIYLATDPNGYALDNSQGQSTQVGGFNNNTYFFNNSPLTILGSGKAVSVVRPTASAFNTADPDTDSDPLLAARLGGSFTASDITLDGSQAKIGVGIGTSGASSLSLTNTAVDNFVADDGVATGSPFGFGVAVNDVAGKGGFSTITNSSFSGNARAALSLSNGNAQVVGSTFTGRGIATQPDVGIQAIGQTNLYVTGSTFTNYLGTSGAALVAAQSIQNGAAVGSGGSLLAVGNTITGNFSGVVLGNLGLTGDTSKAVVSFNNLSGNTVGLDATSSLTGAGVATGVDAGIDGRFNYFGGTGPNRQASTGSNGDQLTNPTGTGSQANGNVRISNFRGVAVPTTTVPGTFGTAANPTLAAAAAAAIQPFAVTAPATLKIYVDPTFTGTAGSAPAGAFNTSGVGPLGTVPAAGLVFISPNTPYGSGPVTAGVSQSYAVADLTTAFDIARDNPGADTIYLAASTAPYALQNANGASATLNGGFNDNTYFFGGDGNTLAIFGSGMGNSIVKPQTGTFDPAVPDTSSDPVFAIRQGGGFTGSDFAFDGAAAKFGGGIGVSGGASATLTRVAVRNFVAEDGSTNGGGTTGFGLYANRTVGAGGFVSIVDSKFSGNGRIGAGFTNADAQVLGTTFTGRGAGDLVDYGVQATGTSKVYVSGSRFSGYLGKATSDGTESAGIIVSQGVDATTGATVAGGSTLLAVGDSLTGNRIGVSVVNIDATGTATADVRFSDLSDNSRAIDASQGGATATATGTNDFFGTGAVATQSPVTATVTVTNRRPVTAPTLSIASGFGTAAAPTLAAAAPAAGTAYVTDPRIQSPVTIAAQGTQPLTGNVTFVVTYTDALVNQDTTLFSATYTPTGKAAQTFTSGQLTIGAPVASGTGSTVTVTVPAALLTGGPAGTVTLVTAPSSTTAQTGNLQLTTNGYQTAGATATAQFGAVNSGVVITPNPAPTAVLTPAAPTATQTFTVTTAAGRTVASVTATSSNAAVTVTRVAGSPNTAPQFTVTSSTATPGSAVITVTATDSDGLSDIATLPVTFGVANSGVTIAPIGNLTFNTNGAAQTVSTTVTANSPGRTITAVTATPSPTGLFTVTRGGTLTSPTFTVTPVAGAVGSGLVTVTATDSDGVTASTAFAVQVGTGVAPTISGLPDTTIPFNGTTGPLTVSVGGVNQPLTVTATSSNTGVATVSITGTGATRTVVVTANPALTTGGATAVTLRVTDAQGISAVQSFNVTVAPQRVRLIAVGSGPGSAPVVQVYGQNGVKLFGFTAFELSFTGGVSVATGDVNGDGVDDIIAGASIGGGPRVRVIDGKTGAEIANFFAFESSNRNGVNVAAGKLVSAGNAANSSGFFREQIIIGAGDGGGPRVSAFDVLPGQGSTPSRIANFFAFEDTFRNGVTVAAGDLTGDGVAEIVTGSGFGGGPRVRAFTAAGAPTGVDFFAFDSTFRGGVNVAAGPLDSTGRASIVAGVGPGGGSLVRVFNSTGTQTTQFQAYSDANTSTKGVRVGTGLFTAGGPEAILTGPADGGGPLFKVFNASNPGAGPAFQDFAFEEPFRGGIFVG